MTSDRSLERRVTRLENETESIYDLITEIRTTQDDHTRRLDGVDGRLDGIDGRLDGIDGRLDGIDGRLAGIDGRLAGIDGRLDGIDGRLDGIGTTVTEILRRLPEPA